MELLYSGSWARVLSTVPKKVTVKLWYLRFKNYAFLEISKIT